MVKLSLVTLIYISGFLDIFGVAMVFPQLIHRAKELGASPAEVGLFSSIYGALQFFCSPLLGQLSDYIGRRRVLMLALLGTSLSYFLLGSAESILFLGLARIPSGMFKFSQAMTKGFIADVMPSDERVAIFGKFNSVSSMGFILGPTIAGWLMMSEGGFRIVAYLSGFVFLLNALFNQYIVEQYITPEVKEAEKKKCERKRRESQGISLFASMNALKDARKVPWHLVWDVFFIRFLMSFSLIIYRANFTSVLTYTFGTTPVMNGYIQSFNGIVSMITAWLIGSIKMAFSSVYVMQNTFAVMILIALFMLTVSPTLFIYVAGIIPLCIASSVLRVINTTEITSRGGEDTRGLVLGLADTLTSLARFIGPVIAGYAFEFHHMAPGFCAVFMAFLGTILVFFSGQVKKTHTE